MPLGIFNKDFLIAPHATQGLNPCLKDQSGMCFTKILPDTDLDSRRTNIKRWPKQATGSVYCGKHITPSSACAFLTV